MTSVVDFLHSMNVSEGAHWIEDLAAAWVDELVDRRSTAVSEIVHRFVATRGGLSTGWGKLPEAEANWRAIFSQFHARVAGIRLDSSPTAPHQSSKLDTSEAPAILGGPKVLAQYLGAMPIEAALNWLETLVYLWAATYDQDTLREQLERAGYTPHEVGPMQVRYFPIALLANLTEP